MTKQPTGAALKARLWATLEALQQGTMSTDTANAIATQSREIVRVVRTELELQKQQVKPVTQQTAAFVE
jgi:hypothetical protein